MDIRRFARLTLKAFVAVFGVTIVIIGFILVPLPGPGLLIVLGGLLLLATEFAWAKRYVELIKRRLPRFGKNRNRNDRK